jgi:protein-S-isoprenylcysteine O-methyltransferase Ste14
VLRPFQKRDTPHAYLESALLLGGVVLAVDIGLNAVAAAFVDARLAIPALRNAAPIRYSGVALVALGLLGSGLAILQMGVSWRIGIDRQKPGALVTDGLFRSVRHPIYAGLLLATTGMALATADLLSVAVAAAAVVGIPVQARLEEEFLGSLYGDEYARYLTRTRRFWP